MQNEQIDVMRASTGIMLFIRRLYQIGGKESIKTNEKRHDTEKTLDIFFKRCYDKKTEEKCYANETAFG